MSDLSCVTLSTITHTNKSTWDEFIIRSPFTSLYYRYEFLQAVEAGTNYKPRHIIVTKDSNIIGVFPNFIQSIPQLPFKILVSMDPGYGGPLINRQENYVIQLMVNQIRHICKRNILAHYIQTQNPGFIRYHHFLLQHGYRLNLRYNHAILSLKDRNYSDIKSCFSERRRRELHKMETKNITITDEPVTTDSLISFHQEYIQTMRRVGGAPYPLTFLLSLNNFLPNRMKLISASKNGENIGQHLYLIDEERNMLISWILAINKEYQKYYPSNLMHDHMIQWAIEQKFNTYDFGYAITDFRDGLFVFKEQFGVTIIPALNWEKSYSLLPIHFIKIGGRFYKKYFKSDQ